MLSTVFFALGATKPESSPLLDALYQASRQDNEKEMTRLLTQAQDLLKQNANVKAVGDQRRTALHWAVIGAMYAKSEKQLQTYLDVVEQLITRGADVNAEDEFGATALDYQENSPHGELTPLLLENGARNGSSQDESARLKQLLASVSSASQTGNPAAVRAALDFDLPLSAELQVRLMTQVSSHKSRSGDVVEAVLIAPVLGGDRVALPAGTRLQGTVMLSQKPANDYQRAQLILNFANLLHLDGSKTRLATRLVDVDNAKESVQAGRILGLAHPNNSKLGWGLRLLGMADPVLSYALQSAIFIRDKEYKRAIEYLPGAEMTLTIQNPIKFQGQPQFSAAVPVLPTPATSAVTELVKAQPLRTQTDSQTPSDLTNLLLVGSREQLEKAFQTAGWSVAEDLNVKSGLKTFLALAESKGYRNAPVSLLLLDGRKPDLVYQKQNDTFAKRHHIRLWKAATQYQNSDVWIAAATHDIAVVVHKEGREWAHRIDTQVDRERTKVTNDLSFAGAVKSFTLVDRPTAPRNDKNATGDRLITDGKMAVLFLR
ncbi:MAG: LssY C-terminal domain-containing protein [Acidobacteriota bacterium]